MTDLTPVAAAAYKLMHLAEVAASRADMQTLSTGAGIGSPTYRALDAAAQRWATLSYHFDHGATMSPEFIASELAAADAAMAGAGDQALPAQAEIILAVLAGGAVPSPGTPEGPDARRVRPFPANPTRTLRAQL
jgi:hypothetical protein